MLQVKTVKPSLWWKLWHGRTHAGYIALENRTLVRGSWFDFFFLQDWLHWFGIMAYDGKSCMSWVHGLLGVRKMRSVVSTRSFMCISNDVVILISITFTSVFVRIVNSNVCGCVCTWCFVPPYVCPSSCPPPVVRTVAFSWFFAWMPNVSCRLIMIISRITNQPHPHSDGQIIASFSALNYCSYSTVEDHTVASQIRCRGPFYVNYKCTLWRMQEYRFFSQGKISQF